MTSASPDSFGLDSRSKLCRQDALPDRRSRLLITTRLSTTRISPLVIEQPFLAPQTAAVPAERAIRSNHPMARDDDANHVRAIRATNCATRIFIAQALCHPRIRTRFANWDRLQDFPSAQLEGGPDRSQRNFELQLLAGEIVPELRTDGFKMSDVSPARHLCTIVSAKSTTHVLSRADR